MSVSTARRGEGRGGAGRAGTLGGVGEQLADREGGSSPIATLARMRSKKGRFVLAQPSAKSDRTANRLLRQMHDFSRFALACVVSSNALPYSDHCVHVAQRPGTKPLPTDHMSREESNSKMLPLHADVSGSFGWLFVWKCTSAPAGAEPDFSCPCALDPELSGSNCNSSCGCSTLSLR